VKTKKRSDHVFFRVRITQAPLHSLTSIQSRVDEKAIDKILRVITRKYEVGVQYFNQIRQILPYFNSENRF